MISSATTHASSWFDQLHGRAKGFMLRRLLGTITSVKTSNPVMALTFDDGPDPESTPRLLDILARYDARATFFVIGRQARRHPALLRDLVEAGHCIANHTDSHRALPTMQPIDRRRDIEACQRSLGQRGARLFRPPRGLMDFASRLDIARLGLEPVTWNAQVEDWARHSAEWFRARLHERVRPGSIVLLHDRLDGADPASADRTAILRGLSQFLAETSDQWSYATVPELLEHGDARRANWLVDHDDDWPRASCYF